MKPSDRDDRNGKGDDEKKHLAEQGNYVAEGLHGRDPIRSASGCKPFYPQAGELLFPGPVKSRALTVFAKSPHAFQFSAKNIPTQILLHRLPSQPARIQFFVGDNFARAHPTFALWSIG